MSRFLDLLEMNNMSINTEEDCQIYFRVQHKIQGDSFSWDVIK